MKQMRAVRFYAPRDIRLESVAVPEPGTGEVLLKVGAALTCGTDLKAYRQGHKLLLGKLPAPFGHELAGTVAAVGRGVEGFRIGDRVAAANSAPCGDCHFCARGEERLCERLLLHNGAYAEYDLIPERIVRRNLWKLPDGLAFADAALSEPLACALHAVDAMRIEAGETAAVLGAGAMALLLVQALRARGARVLVAGRGRDKLAAALKAGAGEAFSALDGELAAAVRAACGGRGADCVFEAVGTEATWRQSVEMARRGGRVCLFGGCAPGTTVPIDAHRLHYEQLELRGVFHHAPLYFKQALDLLCAGRVPTSLLVGRSIRLEDVPAFFERFQAGSAPKAAVLP